MTRRKTPLKERFWDKVVIGPNCWVWVGACDSNGYGRVRRERREDGVEGAQRMSWILANGPIPDGLFVLHHCDNPPCVRPKHLFLGTQADNLADCISKGRRPIKHKKRDAIA